MEAFVSQLGDLREEANRLDRADSPARSDWFSTHPFSPMRLRAAMLFVRSTLAPRPPADPMSVEQLEAEVHELMTIMDPSYLQSKTDNAEAMRRLLFAGGMLIAGADGDIARPELDMVTELLGPGSVPADVNLDAIRETLAQRITDVVQTVPRLRRVQIVRDLCVIANADNRVTRAERAIINDIAERLGVDPAQVACFHADDGPDRNRA